MEDENDDLFDDANDLEALIDAGEIDDVINKGWFVFCLLLQILIK